jgi:hypothetical protein
MRRSTVLSLPLQLVFPGAPYEQALALPTMEQDVFYFSYNKEGSAEKIYKLPMPAS